MEDLQAKHRKELRDLQSRITQKKKQASKKTRRGVNDECDRLEAELKERQHAEIAALEGKSVDGGDPEVLPPEELEKLTLQVDGDEPPARSAPVETEHGGGSSRPTTDRETPETTTPAATKRNRQKERLARRAAEQEELARQAAAEAQNLPDKRTQERGRMLASMKELGLEEKEIRADGHCLYSAVADQLEQLEMPIIVPLGATPATAPDGADERKGGSRGYLAVRARAADYIEAHPDDFAPFLEEPLPEYLRKVRDTGEWGGQLELMALAQTYRTDIHVLQDFGRVEKIQAADGEVPPAKEEETKKTKKVMWLGYYKHGFGLGEHYNSLREAR